MTRKYIDCREFPSEMNCTVALAADSDEELVEALRENPNHERARKRMGYAQFQGGWHTPFEIRQMRSGKVWHDNVYALDHPDATPRQPRIDPQNPHARPTSLSKKCRLRRPAQIG